jgi:hypothetical protein
MIQGAVARDCLLACSECQPQRQRARSSRPVTDNSGDLKGFKTCQVTPVGFGFHTLQCFKSAPLWDSALGIQAQA